MAVHVISSYSLAADGKTAQFFMVGGVVWSRKRLWKNAVLGDTYVTNAAVSLAVSFKSLTNPAVLATSDKANAVSDTLTGLTATVLALPMAGSAV